MVLNYQNELATLQTELNGIKNKTDNNARLNHVQNAKGRLKAKRNKRAQQPFDPKQLPNKSLKANPDNKPKQTEQDFIQAGLHNTPYTQLAALGDFTYDKLTGANNPAYLAETDEITLTQTIKDKATELNHDPVKIYHWVRNNIEWQPTWGAIQDAELTLSAKRGNAMDIASLTIALLRASKIPARYVHGSIDVSAEKFKNWAGGFDNVTAAANYASSGDIPVTTIVSGGQISKIRLEHIWVEAAIDYFPSRGAKNKDADSWIAMDPSYKQYTYQQGLDVVQISGIDAEQLAQSFIDSGTVNETEGWITGFDASVLQSAQSEAQQKLQDHITNNLIDPTVRDVIGGRKTIIKEYPTIPSSLPNKIKVSGSRYDKLPKALQHQVTLEIFNSNINQVLGSPSISYSLPLSQISQKRLGITYVPATSSDETTIQTFIESDASALPLYLISLKPVIKLEEVELAIGGAVAMGSDQLINVILTSPTESSRMLYRSQIAGDEMVVGINAAGINLDHVKQRALHIEASAAENLHKIALSYWAEADYFSQAIASSLGVKEARLPSVGLFSSPLAVTYNFGFPNKGIYLKRNIDIKRSIHSVGFVNNEARKEFVLQNGLMHSYLESSIFEQVIQNWQGTGLSAVQVLIDANQQNIPIYKITNENSGQLLSQLVNVDSAILADINAGLNAGFEAIIPQQQPVKAVGSSGMGYIIVDPETGAGSYRILGGLDGGEGEAPCAEPKLEPLVDSIKSIILTALLLALITLIIIEGGIAAPVIPQMMAALGLSALTFPATAGDFCNPIPLGFHRGNSKIHNDCVDIYPPNEYPGSDVCVSDGIDQKSFDAISHGKTILWEAKTYNFNNSDQRFLIAMDKTDWEKESRIARNCGLGYRYLVGDSRHPSALEEFQTNFVPVIADAIEVDPVNCLTPDK